MATGHVTDAELFQNLEKAFVHMRIESESIHGDWQEIGRTLQQAANNAGRGLFGAFNKIVGLSPQLHGVSKAFQEALSPKISADELKTAIAQSEASMEGHKKEFDDWLRITGKTKKSGDLRADSQQTKAFLAQRAVKQEALAKTLAGLEQERSGNAAILHLQELMRGQMSSLAGVLIPAVVLGFREVWKSTFEINKAFKEATTDAWERYKLLRTTLDVQRETGASTEDINKAMQALVSHGYDLDKNLGDVAKTVAMMELGLGVSADKSAELASSFRNIGQPLVGAADGIARIQRDTALSASSAAQYYTQIARALSLLKPGSGGMAAQVGELVSQFEGASQRVLGRSGDLTKLITEMSGMEGMATAAQLGMQPDFMADPAKVKEALERLNTEVNNRLAGSSGFARVAILESLSAQYGIQKDVLANLNKIVEERNKQTVSQTTLEKEYNAQMALLGNSMAQIKNILMASLRDAFTPLVFGVSQLARGLAYLLEQTVNLTMFGVKPLAWVLTIAVGAAGLVATAQMYRLAKALYAVALAGKAAEVSKAMGGKGGGLTDLLSWKGVKDGFSSAVKSARSTLVKDTSLVGLRMAGSPAAAATLGQKSLGLIGGSVGRMGLGALTGAGMAVAIGGALAAGAVAGSFMNKWANENRDNLSKRGALMRLWYGSIIKFQDASKSAGELYAKWKYNLPDTDNASANPTTGTVNFLSALERIQDMAEDGASKEAILKETVRSMSQLKETQGVDEATRLRMNENFLEMARGSIAKAANYTESGMLTERSESDLAQLRALQEVSEALKSGGLVGQRSEERRQQLKKIELDMQSKQWERDKQERLLETPALRNSRSGGRGRR